MLPLASRLAARNPAQLSEQALTSVDTIVVATGWRRGPLSHMSIPQVPYRSAATAFTSFFRGSILPGKEREQTYPSERPDSKDTDNADHHDFKRLV